MSSAPITTAPRDGTEIQLIDITADTPRWGVGYWMEEYQAFFAGYVEEYESLCADIDRGDADPDDLECSFWPEPTHWAPLLPVPTTVN